MAKRVGGFRRKTRSKMRKNIRQRGKISIKNYFQKFTVGDSVTLVPEPAIQNGMFFPRFQGKTGVVMGMQGACYKIHITDGSLVKELLVHPIHLRRK